MINPSLFKRLFWLAFVPQLLLCIFYWAFGADFGGGETEFQRALMLFYAPAAYIAMIPALFFGWAGVGFFLIALPLIGAILYSLVIALIGHALNTGKLKAFFSLFRSGV